MAFFKILALAASAAAAPLSGSCGSPSDFHDLTVGGSSARILRPIYGPDSRRDEADVSDCWQQVGRSTAMLVSSQRISGNVWGDCPTLADKYPCPDGIRFGNQVTCGDCSGTLIAPNKIATAGHCIESARDCSNNKIVFGATNETTIAGNAIPANTIYSCASVDRSVLTNGADWAVFTLDRPVPASVATPVTVGTQQMPTGAGLMMIGHPSGLPTKYADDATIISIFNSGTEKLSYSTDLDAFGGNSGSGVFTTGFAENEAGQCYTAAIMVGILVSGRADYDFNGCPARYPQGLAGEYISGALTLLPYAEFRQNSSTPVTCAAPAPAPSKAGVVL